MNHTSASDGIANEAAHWVARLESPACEPADRAAFEDWLAQSPAHLAAYLEMERLHADAAALAGDDLLRAAARRARRSAVSSHRPRLLRTLPAIAATLAIAAGAAWWGLRPVPVPVAGVAHVTGVGEQRTVVLDDGTRMTLDTDTRVEARFDADARAVVVERGRVQFEVGRDPARPFRVEAGPGVVRDIGTTFQVVRRGDAVQVALLDGVVMVDGAGRETVTLAPGQQIEVEAAGDVGMAAPLDTVAAAGWPKGELVFQQRPLASLLEEMNRYSDTRVRLADPALGEIRVSGVFHMHDQAALVAALEQGWALRAREVEGGDIVLEPPAG
ncbi:FecR family protein [Novilysobacter selenitireducens]|uniref:FecR domain-containing protein n=1 Tax=Novilysobacter selenitireducens TaxID=2872639 RepID=A0ABS7T756_9GAMM|nr:FecR domain-containing protein [Lysobacter selenitireducens]MBZ4039717.1 FecR domain-containing protein [Lysobacter selenitireducens]